jgi:decaprenylphospho-beta-D-erythro-pentofuranosid-2-ulose 2-reductase
VLLLGGTSEIALAMVGELVAHEECEVVLAGRDVQRLELTARQLSDQGQLGDHRCARVQTLALDAHAPEHHRAAIDRGFELLGGIDLAILAVGILGERGGLPADIDDARNVLAVNTLGAGSMLLECARAMREQGHGTVVVLSSVAAERPRASNAVYCASKAGLDALAQGLGDALASAGVRVMVVRPGFVKTRMTAGLPAPPLSSDPAAVARSTVSGLARGAHTVWVPGVLRWVMLIIRNLPRPLLRRLTL